MLDSYDYITQKTRFGYKTIGYLSRMSFQNGFNSEDDLNHFHYRPETFGYKFGIIPDETELVIKYRINKKEYKVDCLIYSKYYLKTEKSTKI